jgi:hypothetical protein
MFMDMRQKYKKLRCTSTIYSSRAFRGRRPESCIIYTICLLHSPKQCAVHYLVTCRHGSDHMSVDLTLAVSAGLEGRVMSEHVSQ